MIRISCLVLSLWNFTTLAQNWQITEMASMPMATTNNAVCEGRNNGASYVYSFGGLDSLKSYQGIHQKSFRYSINANSWEALSDLPDSLGKIAAAANRIGDTIYIIGGYHVLANGNEISSNKVHRFNTQTNLFMNDGAPLPRAIDDQVQAVWKDSLIVVVTGWSNNGNYPDVQIYNPTSDTWRIGTPVPNTNSYKVFGGSGTIIGDTIYYFGGAYYGTNFPSTNSFVKGALSVTSDSVEVVWSQSSFGPDIRGYRMASLTANGIAFWLGGSKTSYNYNGIAYNGSGGVEPMNKNIFYYPDRGTWDSTTVNLPMDLRGVAKISEYESYIAGGMLEGQLVSDKLFRITFQWPLGIDSETKINPIIVYPNPSSNILRVENYISSEYALFNISGQLIRNGRVDNNEIPIHGLKGTYILRMDGTEFKVVLR